MDSTLTNLLGSAGFSAVGFLIAFFVLKEKFKQDKETAEMMSREVKELCQSIKELIDSINDLKILQAANQEIDRDLKETVTSNYIRIGNKIESQNTKIDDIHTLCVRIYEQSGKVPVGEVAVAKGYLTKEQLDECLEVAERR